jgi:hypothetical protein
MNFRSLNLIWKWIDLIQKKINKWQCSFGPKLAGPNQKQGKVSSFAAGGFAGQIWLIGEKGLDKV